MPSKQRVYIGNLGPDCRERDLEKLFRDFGRLGEVIIRNDFGFVDFDDHRDADDAVNELDGREFLGRRLRVELAKGDREKSFQRDRRSRGSYGRSPPRRNGRWSGPPGRTPRTQWRVIVENISSRTCWQELKDYFRTAGDVNYCTANKISYGVGMVEFVDRRGMESALEKFHNTEFDGKVIRVHEEVGRGMGRGRSRSRSPVKRRSGSSVNRRSRSPVNRRSRSPVHRRSRSPVSRRSRSPNRRSRSPVSRRSPSPNRRSRSPANRRSRSPTNRKSRSPVNRKSRSPANRRSRSPSNRRSKSPVNDRSRSRSPKRRSRSPAHEESRSPTERRSGSLVHE